MWSAGQDVERTLREGELKIREPTPRGSNYTFVVEVRGAADGQTCLAVYKPAQGEEPLWDFPYGTLYKREYAAYLLSRCLHWDLVPPTLVRRGPYGVGSLQLFVEHDPRVNYLTLREKHRDVFQKVACFDVVANNADRKAGHCIQGRDGHIWSIDHGLTFHAQFKLRTVIWEFCGEDVPEQLLDDLRRFRANLDLPKGDTLKLTQQISPDEVKALVGRVDWVLTHRVYPMLDPRRNIPWPPI